MVDRLVRTASSRATGTSASATFAEGTPLDNTHLLVAVVAWSSSIALTAPAGWTEAPGGGNNSSSQIRVYARRADGVVNSFSMTGPSAAKTVYLLAFSGYVSATASVGEGSNPVASGGAFPIAALSSPPDVYGIAVVAVMTGIVVDGTWSNGYALTGTYPAGVGTIHPGRKEYTGPAGSWETAYTTGGSGSGRGIIVVYPLEAPPSEAGVSAALGANPVTLALGAQEVTGIVGG
jgi:hypothetical protein